MKRYRKRLLCALVALGGLALAVAPAQAASFVAGFEGSVSLAGQASGSGNIIVSYAVVNTGTAGAGSFLSTIGGSSTATGQYVYLYEITNTSPRTVGVLQLTTMNPAFLINQGAAAGYAFENPNGNTVAPGSPTNANGGQTAFTPNGTSTPGNSFGTANGLIPYSGSANDPPFSTGFYFRTSGGSDNIMAGQYSELVYFTSNNGPTMGPGQVNDGTNWGPGSMPVATPEPQSYALMVTGLLGLGAMVRWRRRLHGFCPTPA